MGHLARRSCQSFQAFLQAMDCGLGHAHFLGAFAETVPLAQESLELFQLDILKLLHFPLKAVFLGLEVDLERLGIIADDAARLGQVNLETSAFRHAVLPRTPKADDRIHDVFTGRCAALIA